jgi:hypothetical protein
MQDNQKLLTLGVVVGFAGLVAYGLGLHGPLFFDDVPNLTGNLFLHIDGSDFDDWRVAVMSSESGLLHRPLAMFTFVLNYVMSDGFSPAALKATNLVIHLLNAVLIVFFCQTVLRTPALKNLQLGRYQRQVVAVIAGSIWLLHPLHVTTVLYVIQRMAQLSTLFTLAGLLVFCRYRLRWAESGASTGDLIVASLWLMLIGAAAILCKENGALLFWLIPALEVTLFWGVWRSQSRRQLVRLGWVVFALPMVLVMLVWIVSPETLSGRFFAREFSMEERLLTQGRLLWDYLGWILLPNITDMGFFHDDIAISRGLWSPFTTALSLLAWVGAIAVALLQRKRYPVVVFTLFFYLVAHSMESSFLNLEMAFEHRNYLPSVGICLVIALALYRLSVRVSGLRLRVVLASYLAVLTLLLGIRTHIWNDEIRMASFNVVNHPDSPRANFFYANALFKRFEKADDLALTEEERRELAVTSRLYFKRMHNIVERDFAALVMLYQLDTLYFPGLSEQNDWIEKMKISATTKRLRPSDFTALKALVEFSGMHADAAGSLRVSGLLDQVLERYPQRSNLVMLRYKYQRGQNAATDEHLRLLLEQQVAAKPKSTEFYPYLVQYHGKENMAKTYETVGEWMRRDKNRMDLPVIRRMFTH